MRAVSDDYGFPVTTVVGYCTHCDDEHEIEVSQVGYAHHDRDSQGRPYTVDMHEARCFGPRGGGFLALFEPGELVRAWNEYAVASA